MKSLAENRFVLLVPMLAFAAALVTGCSNIAKMENTPEKDNVKMSREDADKDCKELGKVEGRGISAKKSTEESVLADLQQDAANKGANYVKINQWSANKTAVTGEAYLCP
jgi:hypothetical protein